MKARPIKKLDPTHPLGENAARITQVRLDELLALAPRALDGKTKAQHDMRIAAKRLRYVLEVTGFAFGRSADTARRRARDLQDILGEIHDCDVMLPRVREHQKQLQRGDARAVREKAGRAPDLDPRLAARAPHRTAYRGLDVLERHEEPDARGKLEVGRIGLLAADHAGHRLIQQCHAFLGAALLHQGLPDGMHRHQLQVGVAVRPPDLGRLPRQRLACDGIIGNVRGGPQEFPAQFRDLVLDDPGRT